MRTSLLCCLTALTLGAIALAVDRWGRLDCVFNNAGFGGVDEILEAIPMDAYQQTMDVLVKSGSGEADHYAVKAAYEALAQGTEEFASRRMDRSVRSALAGKSLDQVV